MKIFNLILIVGLISSCNNPEDKTAEPEPTENPDTVYNRIADPGTSYEVVETKGFYVWKVDAEKKTLKKNKNINDHSIDADSVINGLNRQYADILLEKISLKKETIHLKISNSDYLTNQIGSTGAAQYIAQAVINLTSVPGIKYVQIDFKMGSHASPGIWTRNDFPGYIIIP